MPIGTGIPPIGYEPLTPNVGRYSYADGRTQVGPMIPELVNGLRAPSVAPPAVPAPAAPPPVARVAAPAAPPAPAGTRLASVTMQPGVDTSAQREQVGQASEREASAQEQLGRAQARSVEAEADTRAAAALQTFNQSQIDIENRERAASDAKTKVDTLLAEKDEKVDPRAAFKELGLGGAGVAVLAAGLVGALNAVANAKSAAAGQGQPFQSNGIVDAIKAHVNQSIESQRDAIANRREQRSNALAVERERWGSEKQAVQALEFRAQDAASRYYEAAAQKYRGTPLEANAVAAAEATRARAAQVQAEMIKDEAGTTQATYQRLQPKGPKSLASQLAEREAAQKIRQGHVSAAVALKMSPEDAEKFVDEKFPELAFVGRGETTEQRDQSNQQAFTSGENAKKAKTEAKDKATDQQRKAADARAAIDRFGEKAGLVFKNGSFMPGPGAFSPGALEKLGNVASLGTAPTPVEDYFDQAVESYGRFRSGGVIGPTERPDFQDQMGKGTTTRAQLASKLNAARAAIDQQLSEEQRAQAESRATIPYPEVQPQAAK